MKTSLKTCESGILSSHCFAILTTLRALGHHLEEVHLSITKAHATDIMNSSLVGYVRTAKLCGALFEDDANNSTVSCAETQFFVDHTEPLEALAAVHKSISWPFYHLPEGHEFLVMIMGRDLGSMERRRAGNYQSSEQWQS